jgi:diguanylate cyclase (GGDEF)-like protein
VTPDRARAPQAHRLWRQLLARTVLPLLPVVILAVVLAMQVSDIARTRAIEDASGSADLIARLGIQPLLPPAALTRGLSPAAYDTLDRSLRTTLLGRRVVRLKVWNSEDRVVYSDDRSLVGRKFPADDGLEAALAGRVHTEITSAAKAENVAERGQGTLLEVYVPLHSGVGHVDGAFEMYLPYKPLQNAIASDTHRLYLLLLAGLGFLYLALLRVAGDGLKLRRHAARTEYLSEHDPLTGLANRALFREQTALHVKTGQPCAVLFVDLDDFKTVNDTLGHAAGDALLVEVGGRLRAAVRASDLVARLGGDEFAVLLDDPATATTVASRIVAAMVEPLAIGRDVVPLSASVGIASTDVVADTDALLRSADIAMYSAKSAGKSGYQVFMPDMLTSLLNRMELEKALRLAIDGDELLVHYQPIHDLDSDRIIALEALVRWQHPTRGLLLPGEFLEIAESTGLILAIGDWVLRDACAQVARWTTATVEVPLQLHVNVSPLQLRQPDFAATVRHVLHDSGLGAAQLVLEVTESQVCNESAVSIAALAELRRQGVRVAIDDFGTGQSSLSRLSEFPIDVLKIDRSFVGRLGHDPAATSVTHAIIMLAMSLGAAVIAEGVEEESQRTQLQKLGCSRGQGFGLSRPASAEVVELLLACGFGERAHGSARYAG